MSGSSITSAFTCTGPYAILIMLGIKHVENRGSLPVPGKGRCAVGCSKSFCKEEFGNFVQWASCALSPADFARIPSWNDVKDWPGRIVGVCDYAASADKPFALADSAAPVFDWDEGLAYWWQLDNVVCFDRPIPCCGNIGMWQMPPALAKQVTVAERLARSVGTRIATASDAAKAFRLALSIAGGNEGGFVLPLDAQGRTLCEPILVSLGEAKTASLRAADVLGEVMRAGGEGFVFAHNHPSGDLTPSADDRAATREIADLARRLNVTFLDHLIVNAAGAFSSLDAL